MGIHTVQFNLSFFLSFAGEGKWEGGVFSYSNSYFARVLIRRFVSTIQLYFFIIGSPAR